MEQATIDSISFLTRSETRVRLLERLREEGPATQRELRDDLDTSRSTVARALTAFQDRGWVRNTEDTYRLSPVGQQVIEATRRFAETVEAAESLAPFLRWFPTEQFDLDTAALSAATVVTPSEGDPYTPARTQTELLREAKRFRGLFPSIDLEGSKLVHDQITSGVLEAEIVVSPSVEETITAGEFAPLFREKLETGRLTVLEANDEPPFYLGIADGEIVQIGVEDDEGFPRALLEVTDERVREWAESAYEEYLEGATPLTVEAF
ncbi:helix-turn-helix transcriptional regulator [Natronomonas sp.]|uniref:helix-turn-helix transcriptional regulator n=1 Tax=Natronomonas sp. TaxID=2184060 RepID=UPI002FC340B1